MVHTDFGAPSHDVLASAANNTAFFHCSACGKCCNTPPALTVLELFEHEQLFVGCLAIGKVRRLQADDRISVGADFYFLDEADIDEITALQSTLLYDPDPEHRSPFLYSVTTQGLDYPSRARCPALSEDGYCSLHDSGKPGICATVPLNPALPNRLQYRVLQSRRKEASYMGADCIALRELEPGEKAGYQPLVKGHHVVDPFYAKALDQRRADLRAEKQRWGNEIFSLLRHELFNNPVQEKRIPDNGYLSLPLVPVLAVLAKESAASRQRCVQYIDRQCALINRMVAEAIARKQVADRETTLELRRMATAYLRQKEYFIHGAV
jgi:Fe-S-cluster containining protein